MLQCADHFRTNNMIGEEINQIPLKANNVLRIRLQSHSASCSSNPPIISTLLQELFRLKLLFFSSSWRSLPVTRSAGVCVLYGNIHMCFLVLCLKVWLWCVLWIHFVFCTLLKWGVFIWKKVSLFFPTWETELLHCGDSHRHYYRVQSISYS